jgi:gliding motility-associated-like protein
MKVMMKKFISTFFLFSICVISYAQLISPFTIRYQTTQKGGIRYISNTAVTCSGVGCGAGRAEVPPAGTSTDNGFTAAYVDIDADGTTFSSSSDSISLPLCSQISWAGLYWGGEMDNTGANYATRNQVKLKVNSGAYTALTASSLQDNNIGFNTYHCFRDITSIVSAAGTNARFTIANVAVRTGGTNRFGGWTIVVVYKNDLQPMRNLTVFNGLSNVSGSNPITDVTVSGFLTPLSGPVTFEVGNLTYDGDRSSTGDQLMFNGGSGFVNISDAVNPLNDIFNSTLSYNGVQKTTPFINPSYTNSLGLDADIFIPNNATKNFIGNSATSATLRLTTGGETYLTQVVSMAIDVYEPDLRAACRVLDLNGGSVLPGDILEYTIVGKNIGSDPAVNVYITDTLEFNAVYVPGSLTITSGPNIGVKTDVAGDDQAEYTAANKTLKIRIGTGANGTTGGQVNNSPLGTDSTQIKFRATATTDCVILQCDNIINNRAYIFGTGNVSGNNWGNGSNPDIFDGSGCPVPGTTTSPISAASCPALTAASNTPVCTGSTISLSTAPASTTATYSWTGPGGFVSSAASPNRAGATATMAGTYTCVISLPSSACSYTVTTTVAVNTTPATPAPSSNTPVCTGNTINLSTAAVAGATYSWTGPSAFASALQNPSRAGATVAMAGTYSVIVTANGCTSGVGTTAVVVNATPATPAPSSNSPVCTGNTINLSTAAVAGATYSWTGPAAFASALQNPSRTGATAAMAGTYSVTVTTSGCTSAIGTVAVVVNTTPATPTASSNTPVCTGNTINLSTPAVAGATYSWAGPNSFSSAVQNPSITGATAVMAGTYSVTVTTSGCTSAVGTTAVVVNTTPATPAPSSNSPACTGNTINLSTAAVAGATYSWTGPNSFSSAVQNPSIIGATAAMAGTYSVTVTTSGCTSAVGTVAVVVNTTPATPTASSNTPVCTGNAINLSTPAVAGATYSWTGPNSFSSAVQNPSIVTATAVMAGTYSVTVTTTGCTSAVGTTSVVINATPATPAPSSNSPVCTGNTINLSTAAVAGATYSWTGPAAFASAIQNPSRAGATAAMAGTYSVTVTTTGCTSAVGTVAVVVNTTPATPTASSNTPVCTGNTINLSTPAVAGATYSWTGPNSFSSAVQNPSILAATAAMAGTYSVTVTTTGCTSAVGTTAVVVNTTPATPAPSSNSPVCTGNAINLSTAAVAGATYSWTGPNSFVSSVQNPSIVSATAVMAGTYSVTVTTSGCTSAIGTVAVIVNTTPATPAPSSNSPVCTGNTINLSTAAVAGATYSWTGPAAFASAVQNPSRVGATAAMTGTYSVTITTTGCTSAVGTTAVIINTTPATPTASSNSPVCTGNTINLSTPAVAGATYSWTGPSSFSSAVQNPSVVSATAVMAGTYSVTVTTTGCTSAVGTVAVIINTTPATPAPSSNSPVCTGNTINLSTAAVAGATYSWTGPGAFASSLQNPARPAATLAMAGTYSLTVTASGCTSAPGTVSVIVSIPPLAPATGSNSPVCTGNAISLTASAIAGATYSWTGPNSFSSSAQNPSIPAATLLMAGTYSVTATIGTCVSPVATTTVAVNSTPASPVATGNSPVCISYPINLDAGTVGSSTYNWSGPSSYSSSSQNAVISNATAAMSGTYSVTATENGCTSSPATVSIAVVNCSPSANFDTASVNEDGTAMITVLANDTDPQSNINTGSVVITTPPVNGTATIGIGGVVTYTPNADFNGPDAFIYQVCDNTLPTPFCDTAIVFITVNPVNDSPVIDNDTAVTNEDVAVSGDVTNAGDSDSDGTALVTGTTPVSGPSNGTILVNADGTYTYTPNPNYNGNDTVVVQVCDSGIPLPAICMNDTIFITISPVNDSPVVNDTTITTNEDTPVTVCIPVSDADNGQTYSVSSCGSPLNGTSVASISGGQVCITYTPNPDFNGTDSLCVLICDNGTPSLCDTAFVNITVIPVNDSPVVNDTTVSTNEDSPVTVCIPVSDADSGQTYSVSSCGNPLNGTSVAGISGGQVCITYTPNPDFNGTDSLCVLICDNGTPSLCDTAFVHITVTPVNDSPVVNDTTITTNEDSPVTVCIPVSDADSGQTYSVSSCGSPLNGASVASISGGQVCITYTPNPNFNGADSLCVLICDNGIPSLCDTAFVNITVTPVNDPPVVDDEVISTLGGIPVSGDVTDAGDADPEGTVLTTGTTPLSGPSNGTITINTDGTYTYTPTSGFAGTDTVVVSVCDSGMPLPALCVNDTIFINVGPAVQNEAASTTTNVAVNGNMNTNELPSAGFVYTTTPVDAPNNGTITVNTNGTFTYTPLSGFSGYDTVVVTTCYTLIVPAACSNDTIFITVYPDVNNETVSTPQDSTISGTMANDSGSGLTYGTTPVDGPDNGTITVNADGTFTYIPNSGYAGTDTVVVTVCDASLPPLCANDTLFINVMNGPVVVNEHVSGTTGSPISGNILTNDSPSGSTTGGIIDNTNNGTITVNTTDGSFIYTPNPGFSGYDTLIINVCFNAICVADTVFITVNPDVNNESVSVTSGGSYNGTMATNDSGTGLTYGTTPVDGPDNGTITVSSDGTFTYTPNPGYTGADTVIVTVCDGSVPPLCSTDTIFIAVANGPAVVNENVSGTTGNPITGNVLGNDSPSGVTVGTVIDNTNNGTAVVNPTDGTFTYTPNPGFSGYDTLIVNVCFGGVCEPDTVFITVNPDINNENISVTSGGSYNGTMLTNDSGTGLTYGTTPVDGPDNGTITVNANGSYTYTPNPGYTGADTVIVTVCDASVPPLCSVDTIFITVTNGPVVVNENVSGTSGSPIPGNVLTNDSPSDVTLGGIIDSTNNGTIILNGTNGSFIYTSDPGFSGYDTLIVNVCFGGVCQPDTVFITVYPDVNNDNGTSSNGGDTYAGNVLSNDSGTVLTADTTVVTPPVNGSVVILPNGDYIYTPDPGSCGPDSFAYQACDNSVPRLCGTAWVYINVTCDTVAPTVAADLFNPEGFSPNGDGVNDLYIIRGIENYPNNTFVIFNRWGNKVFDAKPYTNTWDGTNQFGVRIGNDQLPVGTYFYILDLGDGSAVIKGYIYLNR